MRCFFVHVKGRRRISLALSLLIGFILIAGAALAVPVPVLAISAGGIRSTIASIIISLLLQTGVAPTNTAWLNQLNNAYGVSSSIGTIEDCISSGLLTETASGLVDTGLSNAISSLPEYTSLGLDEMFTTTATDVGVTAASGAINIANTAINVGTLGTIGAFAGAVAVGVGLGVLINHVREKIADYIRYNISGDTTNTDFLNNVPSSYSKQYNLVRLSNNRYIYGQMRFVPSDVYCVGYHNGNYGISADCFRGNARYTGGSYAVYTLRDNPAPPPGRITSQGEESGDASLGFANNSANVMIENNFDRMFNNATEYNNWKNALLNGTEQPISSNQVADDFVGPLGNQYTAVNPETGNTIYPGIQNVVPEGYDMKPIDMSEYETYVNNANQNTEDGLTGQDSQGAEFMQFIDPYLVAPDNPDNPDIPVNPNTPIIPENPNGVPTYPERPIVPEQPENIPEKEDPSSEEIEEALNMSLTPDLRSVFPFCIPWDIYNIVCIFDTGANRQAPRIEFTFPGTDWTIEVDLSEYDTVAGILRLLELILFIVGLMVATRSLIGAGG